MDFRLCNQVAGYPYNLPLCSDFRTASQLIHKEMMNVKRNFRALGTFYLTLAITSVPTCLGLLIVRIFASKPSFIMTNVFGPPVPSKIDGKKSLRIRALLPGMAEITGGFAVLSHYDIAKVSFCAD